MEHLIGTNLATGTNGNRQGCEMWASKISTERYPFHFVLPSLTSQWCMLFFSQSIHVLLYKKEKYHSDFFSKVFLEIPEIFPNRVSNSTLGCLDSMLFLFATQCNEWISNLDLIPTENKTTFAYVPSMKIILIIEVCCIGISSSLHNP